MSLFKVFDVAGSAMNAQSVRMNVTASNLANAGSVSGDADNVYRARQPVFSTFGESMANVQGVAGVRLDGVVESSAPLQMLYQPDHPEADADGNVYATNVNTVEEMVNMISASRSYKNNVEMINTTKDLLLQTLSLGR
ncbi:MAG: flagellar basal body rod protein FlgC [Gammaproteobacteria bacterium]|nr:flagellar basal body rod protein FlgC [Gammaproteobacteria bacterium]